MIHLKAALLLAATLVILAGTYGLVSFYTAYPEDAPAPVWVLIAAGAALWFASLFLISRLPDEN